MSQSTKPASRGFLGILLNTGWLTIARVSGDIAGVILFIGISRNLGLEGIGLYSYGFAIATLVAAFIGVGLEEYGLREYSRLDVAERRSTFRDIMGLQVVLLFLVLAGLMLFTVLVDVPTVTAAVVAIITLHVLTFQFATMFFIPAFAHHHMFAPAAAELVCRVGAMCVCTWLVTKGDSSLAVAMLPLGIGTTILLGISMWSARHYNGELRVTLQWRQVVLTFGKIWSFAVSTIIYNVYGRVAVVMLTLFHSEAITGIYGTALKLYEFGLMPMYMLGVAVFPALSHSFGSNDVEFGKTADLFLRTALLVGALLAWGLIFVAPPILVVVLGEEFANAVLATRMMAVVALLAALDIVSLRLILAMNLHVKRVKIQTFAVAANVIANFLLIPKFGVYGAIAATVLAQIMMIYGYFRYFRRTGPSRGLIGALGKFALIVGLVIAVTTGSLKLGLAYWLVAAESLILLLGLVLITKFAPSLRHMLRPAAV